jgi:Glycosyltransferase family 87
MAARLARMIGPGATARAGAASGRFGRAVVGVNHARGGLAVDIVLYGAGALFAGLTAASASLPPHRAWGHIAVWGYAAATLVAVLQAVAVRRRRFAGTSARALVTAVTFVATAVLPMLVEAVQRAGGRLDRAQEEVGVVESGGVRLWHTGTPYLSHDAIAALPPGQRLGAYLPYQPVMALFGLPRAIGHAAWWTDARVWFTVTLIVTVAWAVRLLRRGDRRGPGNHPTFAGHDRTYDVRDAALVRAAQAALVFPICALTIATGGDDLPVLGLTLLALAFAARGRHTAAGVTIGVAGALKLFAWPVALILIALAAADGWRRRNPLPPGPVDQPRSLLSAADWPTALRCAAGAIGIPAIVLIPPFIVDSGSAIENVVRFPLGHGLVKSPAASPFPGHLIADNVSGGSTIATVLLILAAVAIAVWLVWRPPADAGAAAAIAAWSLIAAIALIPSTRFGYLLYPVAYACWIPALRRPTATVSAGPHPTAAEVVAADPAV